MTRQKDKGTYVVLVRVSQVVQRDGKAAEELVAQPKIVSAPGVPASLFTGPQPSNPDYGTRETVDVDVSWPEAGQKGFAVCEVTVKLGGQVVCKSKTQVAVEEK